jgi:predicted transcriptional regulator of viral defense system
MMRDVAFRDSIAASASDPHRGRGALDEFVQSMTAPPQARTDSLGVRNAFRYVSAVFPAIPARLSASGLIADLASRGRYDFTTDEATKALGTSPVAARAALRRLARRQAIASPQRSFHVIVPPEYRRLGCLPPEQFVPQLMALRGLDYYVGLLSAAQYHGVAHQRPQQFQVMVERNRPPIACGEVRLLFVARKAVARVPVNTLNTPRGPLRVSTPEATALDLVGYPRHAGGLDGVATLRRRRWQAHHRLPGCAARPAREGGPPPGHPRRDPRHDREARRPAIPDHAPRPGHGEPRSQRHDAARLRLAGRAQAAAPFRDLRPRVHPRHGRVRIALTLNERIFTFCLKDRDGRVVDAKHGLDPFAAVVADDERLPARFRETRYPQMQREIGARRAKRRA